MASRILPSFDSEGAWRAVLARDKAADGRFITGVLTTGIYCRPSCAARHPKREHVRFFATSAEAAAAGLRACLRCRPDEVARDIAAIDRALRLIETAEEPPNLETLARAAGYSNFHFHRIFKRTTGVTPAAEWIRVTSSASSWCSGGRRPGSREASMVLPEPGGPTNRRW